jgi:hypothetical protein
MTMPGAAVAGDAAARSMSVGAHFSAAPSDYRLVRHFSAGPGALGLRVEGFPAKLRDEVQQHVRAGYLAGMPDGPRSFAAIVRAVRGIVPK